MHCRLSPAFLLASLAVGQVFVAPAARGDEGVASYTLYELRQTLKTIDFGENRQQSLAEFTGVVRSEQAGSMFDSMTEYCIGTFFNDGKQRSGNGGCKLVDADGDQVFQTFNTSSSATPPPGRLASSAAPASTRVSKAGVPIPCRSSTARRTDKRCWC
jgi:hypothetical protein